MMLTRQAIRDALRSGTITITPLDDEQVRECSVDLHLGETLAVYGSMQADRRVVDRSEGYEFVLDKECPCEAFRDGRGYGCHLDLAQEDGAYPLTIPPGGLVLMPGVLYLGHTIERIGSTAYAGIVAGKSSTARKGLKVESAGLIEPGFSGQVTLEIEVAVPLRIHAGHPVAQIRYHVLAGGVTPYAGHYTGEHATGPVPSRSHLHTRRHVGKEYLLCRASTSNNPTASTPALAPSSMTSRSWD